MHINQIINIMKERRKLLGVTQEQLVKIAGVGVRTLKAIESGRANPTFDTIIKIFDALGLDIKLFVKNLNN